MVVTVYTLVVGGSCRQTVSTVYYLLSSRARQFDGCRSVVGGRLHDDGATTAAAMTMAVIVYGLTEFEKKVKRQQRDSDRPSIVWSNDFFDILIDLALDRVFAVGLSRRTNLGTINNNNNR